jgi:Uma2 family endonuclease
MSRAKVEGIVMLTSELAGTLMTPEEFDAVEDCDRDSKYELVHGVLIVTPPPLAAERSPNEVLGHMLWTYQEQHPQGRALDDTLPEQTVRTTNRRRADRVIWAGMGRVPDPSKDTRTIVAEFVSTGDRSRRRDYEEKKEEYEAAGILEYWVIDRFRRILTIYRAGAAERIVTERERYTTPLLPGFELDLQRLLAAADRYSESKRKS